VEQKELPFTLLCQLSWTTRFKDGRSTIMNKRISIVEDDDESDITSSLRVSLEYNKDDEFKVLKFIHSMTLYQRS
jgi:hypothetical protein